jgi:hypothetical protein
LSAEAVFPSFPPGQKQRGAEKISAPTVKKFRFFPPPAGAENQAAAERQKYISAQNKAPKAFLRSVSGKMAPFLLIKFSAYKKQPIINGEKS